MVFVASISPQFRFDGPTDDILLQQDEINILQGAPRKIWILREITEAQRLFMNSSDIYTADFSTMYTNLP